VLGFRLPFYASPTLLLSLGLSVRVLWHLIRQRPDVIHVSTPGVMFLACTLYSRLLNIPLVMSYHTHIPEYIPRYTWAGLVRRGSRVHGAGRWALAAAWPGACQEAAVQPARCPHRPPRPLACTQSRAARHAGVPAPPAASPPPSGAPNVGHHPLVHSHGGPDPGHLQGHAGARAQRPALLAQQALGRAAHAARLPAAPQALPAPQLHAPASQPAPRPARTSTRRPDLPAAASQPPPTAPPLPARRAGGAGAQPLPQQAHRHLAAGRGHRGVPPAACQRGDARTDDGRAPRGATAGVRGAAGRRWAGWVPAGGEAGGALAAAAGAGAAGLCARVGQGASAAARPAGTGPC
jgi:hypothetical protein